MHAHTEKNDKRKPVIMVVVNWYEPIQIYQFSTNKICISYRSMKQNMHSFIVLIKYVLHSPAYVSHDKSFILALNFPYCPK